MNNKTPLDNEYEKPEIEKDTGNQTEREIEQVPEDKPEIGEESSWSKDQQERNYYYDDAHGYEDYDPADKSEEE